MSPPLHLLLLLLLSLTATTTTTTTVSNPSPTFLEAPSFRNPPSCLHLPPIHISMTLDSTYLRGSLAGILSILHHSSCPQSLFFHFISIPPFHPLLLPTLSSSFPSLSFHIYPFNPLLLLPNISPSLRPALNQPLNYARIYLPHLLPVSLPRVIYLDSDLILLDDIKHLWSINLTPHVIGAPEYCHANLTRYFTHRFWSDPVFPNTFKNRKRRPCYFNTGVMVMDLVKWRAGGYTRKLERWMEVQKRVFRIYELGSLPPFLLVFAGEVKRIGHRWNQHGLGGDNVEGQCRNLHPGPVSLLHWSGKGKPWLRLDAGRPCQLDGLWKPYDLLRRDLIVD